MIRENDGTTRLGISYFYPTGIGELPSGVRTTPIGQQDPLTDSADPTADTPLPYTIPDPAQSGVAGSPPWQAEPGGIPKPYSNPTSQTWGDGAVVIGAQIPFSGRDADDESQLEK